MKILGRESVSNTSTIKSLWSGTLSQGSVRYEGEFKAGLKHGKLTCYHKEEPGVEKAGSIFNEKWNEGVLVEGSQEEITNEPQLAFYKNGRPNKASVDSWIEMKSQGETKSKGEVQVGQTS